MSAALPARSASSAGALSASPHLPSRPRLVIGHDSSLLNLAGHSTGALVFGIFLHLLLRDGADLPGSPADLYGRRAGVPSSGICADSTVVEVLAQDLPRQRFVWRRWRKLACNSEERRTSRPRRCGRSSDGAVRTCICSIPPMTSKRLLLKLSNGMEAVVSKRMAGAIPRGRLPIDAPGIWGFDNLSPKLAMRRREFLGTCAAAAAGGNLWAGSAAWFDRPMRWAQLTLVEDDPGKYDLQFWLDYFKRTHSDAACLSAGGCVAFYPTKVPLHYRSAWLGDRDPFGDLVAGCRKLGMVVVARTDPHAAHDDVFRKHPDWIAVDAEAKPRRHWASPELWVTCALGPYNFEFMTEVTREIVSLYKVDAVFSNRWAGHGICYCEHCRRNFKAASGMDLPRTTDARDPARRAYLVWRQKRLFDLWRMWDAEVRKINPGACFIANSGGGALSDLDMKTVGELAPTIAADRQARRGLMPPWENGKNAKEYRATMGRKPVMGLFSVGVEEPYRWKDSVQCEPEMRLWVLDGIANGMRPWFSKFSGTLHDRRWLDPVAKIFDWHYRNERYLRNEEPLARVAVVYSQQTAAYYGAKVEDHTLGMYQALIEARIPFEMVHDRLLDAEHIDRFKLLILPNIAALSGAQCEQLRGYVARGGSLVATFETSLYDEWGERRADFGLAGLFGASFAGRVEGPMQNSYLRIEKDPSGRFHPLLGGLEDAPRIINGVRRVDVKPSEPFPNPPLTLIPSYPDLPMEMVYPRQPKTDIAQVYLRQRGRGRVVYFPWDIDRTFWEVLSVDHWTLLRNAFHWALDEESPVTVTGPGILDVTVWRQKDSMTVHLVNLTNPMMMKGPLREFLPVGAQRVRVRIPQGRSAKGVHLLAAGGAPAFTERNGFLELTVPSILDHEVVAIDLG